MQVCKRIYQREVRSEEEDSSMRDDCEVAALGALLTFESGGMVNDNNDSPCKERTKPRRGDRRGQQKKRK